MFSGLSRLAAEESQKPDFANPPDVEVGPVASRRQGPYPFSKALPKVAGINQDSIG